MQLTAGRWLLDHDPDATRRCYAQLAVGSSCDCCCCRNFVAAARQSLPPEFLALTDALGVDPTKPVELGHYGREHSGLYLTDGWFHFVGTIRSGEDVMEWSGSAGTYRFEELVPGLEFGFGSRLALVREVFEGFPLVQLEFMTRIPWVLGEEEPEEA